MEKQEMRTVNGILSYVQTVRSYPDGSLNDCTGYSEEYLDVAGPIREEMIWSSNYGFPQWVGFFTRPWCPSECVSSRFDKTYDVIC